MNIEYLRPRKVVVPLAVGQAWRNDGRMLYQVKEDGEFSMRTIAGAQITIEHMRRDRWVAVDCVVLGSENLLTWPLRARWDVLNARNLSQSITRAGGRIVESSPDGAALLKRVLAQGGEGVVGKAWDAPYGEMFACKRVETFQCVVMATGGTQSVAIADACTMAPRGHVALRGGKCDRVRVGSIIKVEGMGLTLAGFIREPRPCKDTATSWMVRF